MDKVLFVCINTKFQIGFNRILIAWRCVLMGVNIGATGWFQYGAKSNYITSQDEYTNRQGMVKSYNQARQNARGMQALQKGQTSIMVGKGKIARTNTMQNDKMSEQRRMLAGNQTQENLAASRTGNIVSDSLGYANSLSNTRSSSKKTSLELKKLQYDFKGISSQIIRSKTSHSAKQAASKARREVLRLKRQKQSGKYDEEEIQSAIVHAQAMERVAKKKARHLLEEEMVKVGGGCLGELEDEKKVKRDQLAESQKGQESNLKEQEIVEDGNATLDETMQESIMQGNAFGGNKSEEYWQNIMNDVMSEMIEEGIINASDRDVIFQGAMDRLQESMDMLQDNMEMSQEYMTEEMTLAQEEMWDSMEEMMDEDILKDLMEEMGGETVVAKDMDPADYKMMKIKHRSDEMKAMAKADGEYLKALFERYEKAKSAGLSMGKSGGAVGAAGVSVGGSAGGLSMASTGGGFTGVEVNSLGMNPQVTVSIDMSV